MSFIFVLIVALHGNPDTQIVGAFHRRDICVQTGKDLSHIKGSRMSGFTCKETMLSDR